MTPNPPDRSNTVKELEERLLKKWKTEKARDTPDKKAEPAKPVVLPPAKKDK
jgi:hypothetical protein